jgi:UDP-glucose 4-epimerase
METLYKKGKYIMKTQKRILVITGAFGYVGSRVVERLKKSKFYSKIVCTDIIKPDTSLPTHFVYEHCDIRDGQRLKDIFINHKVTDVLHLAYLSNPTRDYKLEYEIDILGSENVLRATAAAKAIKFVIASSDCAYGFFPDTPDYLDETAPLRPTPGFTYAIHKVEIEHNVAQFAKDNPKTKVVIMRPCIIMGPHCKSAVAKSLKQPFILGFKGYNPIMQFIHEDDAAEAFYLALTKNVQGAFNLAADNGLRYDEMAKVAGKPLVQIPEGIMKPIVSAFYTLHLLPFGPGQLTYIQYPLSMKADKIKKVLGFKPRYSSEQAIRAYLFPEA